MDVPPFLRRLMASPPCTDAEAAALAARAKAGDAAAEEELVARHAKLVVRMAGLVKSRLVDHEERVQLALVILLRSIRTFDPSFGVPFRTYAATQIRFRIWKQTQAEGRALRTVSWLTHGVCDNTDCASYGVVREVEPLRSKFKCPDCGMPGALYQKPLYSLSEDDEAVDPATIPERDEGPVSPIAELERLCTVAEKRGLIEAEHAQVFLLKARGLTDVEIVKRLGIHRTTVYRHYVKAKAGVRKVFNAT